MWVFVAAAAAVGLAAALWWVWQRRKDRDLISPLPFLGCALAFRRDPVGFLCGIAERGRNVTLNMAGLRMRLLVEPEDVAVFYRSKSLSSYEALRGLGFERSLGVLNVRVGGQLHSRILRAGRSFGPDTQQRLRAAAEAALARHESGRELELYRFCRELVVLFAAEEFAGAAVAQLPLFCEQYLDFQLAHESAVARAMVLGCALAGPALDAAWRKRHQLAMRIAPVLASPHAEQLGEEYGSLERADLVLGLLTAATKNVAIGSASSLVFMLQHGWRGEGEVAAAVAETLRLTCLSFGALRLATDESGPECPRGLLLTVSHLARGRSATLFADPHRWNPARRPDVAFCFGAGLHACPGKTFALESMAKIVAAVWPRLGALGRCSDLRFDRPSLADRDFAFAVMKA